MADLSKVKLNNTIYNLKDTVARERLTAINIPTTVSSFTNDAGYLTSYTETDPVFTASAAAGITSNDITNWNNKLSSAPVTSVNGQTGAVTLTIPSSAADIGAAASSHSHSSISNSHNISGTSATVSTDCNSGTQAIYLNAELQNGGSSIQLGENQIKLITSSYGPVQSNTITITRTSVTGIPTPTTNTGAANKKYVDDSISGLTIPTAYNATTNPTGYLTINDLPTYDGTVV